MIKNSIVRTLASPNKNARKGASLAVSAIASIELPLKQWPDLITTLTNGAQAENADFKHSCLETLGYICEELEKETLGVEQVDGILTALIINSTSATATDDIKLLSLSSLCSCLHLCTKNFNAENEKSILMTNIIGCIASTNQDIKIKAIQCIVEIVTCFYDFIGGPTLEQLGHGTFSEIKQEESEEVSIAAVEVWSSISDMDIEREMRNDPKLPCRNYIATAYGALVPLLLESLKRQPADEDEDWNLSVASACCLSKIAEIAKDNITAPVLSFISPNICSPDWKCRKAAVLAFGSILKGPQKHMMNQLVNAALQSILKMLQDENLQVRITTAWTFEKISEHTYEPLKIPQAFMTIANGFIASLKDCPKVSNQICFALYNLAYSLRPGENQQTCLMSQVFKEALQALWENAFRSDAFGDSINLAHASFAAFTNIVQYSANDAIPALEPVLNMLVETFSRTIKGTFAIPGKVEDYQGYLCVALQPVFSKLPGKASANAAGIFVDLLIESFKMRKTVYDDGISSISGIINSIGKDIISYMPKIYPYLDYALKNTEDANLLKVAVGCVADLSRALDDQMAQFLPNIFPVLLKILNSEVTERTTKLDIICTLGDIAMAASKSFTAYLHDSFEMLKSAAALSLQTPQEVKMAYNI